MKRIQWRILGVGVVGLAVVGLAWGSCRAVPGEQAAVQEGAMFHKKSGLVLSLGAVAAGVRNGEGKRQPAAASPTAQAARHLPCRKPASAAICAKAALRQRSRSSGEIRVATTAGLTAATGQSLEGQPGGGCPGAPPTAVQPFASLALHETPWRSPPHDQLLVSGLQSRPERP